MFTKELLQAINDWQRGGDKKQKERRGKKLKEECSQLPKEFRVCQLCCFRQLALEKGSLWQLADQLKLPETISAWTISPEIARIFKNGVPPSGLQGIIFTTYPSPDSIIVNLDRLYRNREFNEAIELNKSAINCFSDGIGRYRGTQKEVIVEIDSIELNDVFELGGFSGSRDELVRHIYGNAPTANDYADFDFLLAMSGQKLGACWIGDGSKDRVIKKIQNVMPHLRTIKRLQEIPA